MSTKHRKRLAIGMIALGIAVIAAAALYVASAGYGTRVLRSPGERHSAEMVRRDVLTSFFPGLVGMLCGLAIAVAGGKLLPPAEVAAPGSSAPGPR